MVVSEALSYGLPVLCFQNDGPGEFVNESCAITVPYSRYDTSITKFAEGLHKLYWNRALHERLSQGARDCYRDGFNWDNRGEKLREVYEALIRKAG